MDTDTRKVSLVRMCAFDIYAGSLFPTRRTKKMLDDVKDNVSDGNQTSFSIIQNHATWWLNESTTCWIHQC